MSAKDRTATTDLSGLSTGENKRNVPSETTGETVVFSPVTSSRGEAGQRPAGPRKSVVGTAAKKKQMRRTMVAETLRAWRGRIILAVCVMLGSVLLVAGVYATSEIASSLNRESGASSGASRTENQINEKESAVFSFKLEGETEDKAEKSAKEASAEKTETDPTNSDGGVNPASEPDEDPEVEAEPDPERFTVEIRFSDRDTLWVETTGETVRELLDEIGYSLDENHFLNNVGLDDYIWTDTVIEVSTIYYATETVTEYVPFDTVYVNSEDYPAGTTQVTTEGVNGVIDVTYTVEYIDGVETYRSRDAENVVSYPTDQVITIGTAVSQADAQGGVIYGADGTAYSYSDVITVRATYYNLPGNTASGLPVGDGVIAVDPSVIPLGTSVYLKNDAMDVGVRVAADTGVYGNTVDIWMNEKSPLFNVFAPAGVWEMTCYILD